MSKDIAIEFKAINFSYDDKIQTIKNISFKVNKGDYTCIVGPNGSGKSTLSKLISMLMKPSSGSIYIFGNEVNDNNVHLHKRKIGVIFQNPDNQFIGITGEDDIAFGLENYNVKNSMMKPIIKQSANIININDFLNKEVHELSGGQKQKVAITSVVALMPEIIIFDESTSMLDPKNKIAIKKMMKWLQENFNKTIISITHDMEELKNANKILCINNGEIVKHAKLEDYIEDYDFITKNKLELPKNLKLIKLLNEKGMKLKPTLDENKLVRDLCK